MITKLKGEKGVSKKKQSMDSEASKTEFTGFQAIIQEIKALRILVQSIEASLKEML